MTADDRRADWSRLPAPELMGYQESARWAGQILDVLVRGFGWTATVVRAEQHADDVYVFRADLLDAGDNETARATIRVIHAAGSQGATLKLKMRNDLTVWRT